MKIEPATSVELLETLNAVLTVLTGIAVTLGLVVLAATGTVGIWSALLYWAIGLPVTGLLFAMSALSVPLVFVLAHSSERELVADGYEPAVAEKS